MRKEYEGLGLYREMQTANCPEEQMGYTIPSQLHEMHARVIEQFLRVYCEEDTVFDIGMGTGMFAEKLCNAGVIRDDYFGIEPLTHLFEQIDCTAFGRVKQLMLEEVEDTQADHVLLIGVCGSYSDPWNLVDRAWKLARKSLTVSLLMAPWYKGTLPRRTRQEAVCGFSAMASRLQITFAAESVFTLERE